MIALKIEEQDAPSKTEGGIENLEPIPSCVRLFKKGAQEQLLTASVKPNSEYPTGIPIRLVHDWIRAQGCENWLQNEDQISLLAREIRKLNDTKEYTLAERKDCAIDLQTDSDKQHAWITIIPAHGGAPLSASLLAEAFEKKNIRFGIKEEIRDQILQAGQCTKTLIAEGIPPIHGEPARFEPLVHESKTKGIPQEKDHGRVDYKELQIYLSVGKNAPLLKRIPPEDGVPGKAIDGSDIPAPQRPDRQLKPGPGTAISPDDPNLIIASRGGTPTFDGNYVRVDPTLEINGINPSTGNITYDGNIVITGPVEPGFRISASENLTVYDTVEGSDLTAGKNIVLMTGVYGRGKTRITAGGHLDAKFLNECIVNCAGNINITDLASHCTIECQGIVYLGRNGGKGQLIGGKVTALREIQAQILGSVSEIPTTVIIGVPQDLSLQNEKLEKDIAELRKKLETIESKFRSLANQPSLQNSPPAIKLHEAAILFAQNLAKLEESHDAMQKKIAAAASGRIKAAEAHRGVVLLRTPHRKVIEEYTTDMIFQPLPEEIADQNKPPASINVDEL